MKGNLSEHSVGELLRAISINGLSGALRLQRDRVKVILYFDDGNIILGVSNHRVLRLDSCLRRWNILDESKLRSFGDSDSDLALAKALVDAGALTDEQVTECLARQAAEVARFVLLWCDGEWSFDARVRVAHSQLSAPRRMPVEISELLVESARRLPDEFVASRFAHGDEILSVASSENGTPELLPVEGFVLSRIEGTAVSVRDLLLLSGVAEGDALRSIYSLILGGLVRREGGPRPFTTEEIESARAAARSHARSHPSPAIAPQVMSSAATAVPSQANTPAEAEAGEEENLELLFERLSRAEDHYAVLGVAQSAPPAEVKRSYYDLARRFHPDRFHHEDRAVHAQVEAAFARMAAAYEVLKDKRQRADYDVKLQAAKMGRGGASAASQHSVSQQRPGASKHGPPEASRARTAHSSEASHAETARKSFDSGRDALQRGRLQDALLALAEAARLAPNEAHYRCTYGRALAQQGSTRRQAEAELQAAITLDPRNAGYRVSLAELYRDLGLQRRAEGEAQRALAVDPNNEPARRLIQSLAAGGVSRAR